MMLKIIFVDQKDEKGRSRDGLDDFLRDVMIRNGKEKLKEQTRKIKLGEHDKLNYLFY